MNRYIKILILFAGIVFSTLSIAQEQRFPKPEFESGHTQPEVQIYAPDSQFQEYFDVFVLFAALSIVTWLVIKKRSRKGVLYMTIFSVAYFGFYREGCICSVGSLQNVFLALFNSSYSIPITTLLIFMLPLVFTLFYGRTFCAGVCPLGAIQDLVAIKPIELKPWIQKSLGILPFVYLGLAVLYASTASDFVVCRYDPFVGIYRLNGTFFMFAIGAILLLIGVFIARPYCRFLCPYGVILSWVSRFSKDHMSITPSVCVQCKLCEHSCPYGAIDKPTESKLKWNRFKLVKSWTIYILIIPVLLGFGAYFGYEAHETLARVNPKVALADKITYAINNPEEEEILDVSSFKETGQSIDELLLESELIVEDFKLGSIILGLFVALSIGLTLSKLARYRYREDYEANKADCLSCTRCMDFCPVDENGIVEDNKGIYGYSK